MKIKELPLTERPRERMMNQGQESLSNTELLAIIIGSGSTAKSSLELANDVISMMNRGFVDLGNVSAVDLACLPGIGEAKAAKVLAAVEIGKRLASAKMASAGMIRESADAASIVMERMRHYKKEHFDVLLLDSKGQIIKNENISIGDLSSSIVNPREVFLPAIRSSAASVIFIHNHPSGDPEPSDDDIKITRRLKAVGDLLGINVHDHIIIGDGVFTSLTQRGYLD